MEDLNKSRDVKPAKFNYSAEIKMTNFSLLIPVKERWGKLADVSYLLSHVICLGSKPIVFISPNRSRGPNRKQGQDRRLGWSRSQVLTRKLGPGQEIGPGTELGTGPGAEPETAGDRSRCPSRGMGQKRCRGQNRSQDFTRMAK